ncbi:MAG: thiamine-phosphate kinase [Oceanicaulis sp.]
MAGEGEFDFIARALAPLTRGHSGAYGLKDDGAILAPSEGCTFAVTTDTLVEGVHFPAGEDPFLVGWKALAANVSDLLAMGAAPGVYLLNIVWPAGGLEARADAFVAGLKAAQDQFKLVLVGGDTTKADGPWVVSITAMGETPGGETPRRGNARPGDALVATGSYGDAWLGLQQHLGVIRFEQADAARFVDLRFRKPVPPVELVEMIRRARAAIDVSDGLLADAGHILSASGMAGTIDLAAVPVSDVAEAWIKSQPGPVQARLELATGGDDYEIVAAVPQSGVAEFLEQCAARGRPAAIIGRVSEGSGLTVTYDGKPVDPGRLGFTHF